MEKQLSEIPVLKKSKDPKSHAVSTESSCCVKPAGETACCTPGKSKEENNGACCEQPADGSACCEK